MEKPASQISSTRPIERRPLTRGFTLVEVLIAFGLASIIMTGIMTTFLMMGRTGILAQNYTELEVEARKALELFSRETRMANGITAYSDTSVSMTIPDTSWDRTVTAYTVTYTFDANAMTFTRTGPPITDPTQANATTTLVTNVQQIPRTDGSMTPYIRYYKYVTTGYATGFQTNTAASTTEIKQIELNFIAKRDSNRAVASSTDKVLSARFIVRNK